MLEESIDIALALPGGFDLGNLDRWLHIISGVMWIVIGSITAAMIKQGAATTLSS